MSEVGTGAFGYRWEGRSHQELYDMVTAGAHGAGVIQESDRAWSELVDLMTESRERIARLEREAGVVWVGQAADATAVGVSPLGRWAEDTATAGVASRASLHQIVDGFTVTARSMPEPVPVPSKLAQGIPSDFPGLLAGQTDEDATERQAQRAHHHAIELMHGYTANNADSTTTAGAFATPPEIGISTAERGDAGGSAGGALDRAAFGHDDHGGGQRDPNGDSGRVGPSTPTGSGDGGPTTGRPRPAELPPPPGQDTPGSTAPARTPISGQLPSGLNAPPATPPGTDAPFAPAVRTVTEPTTGRQFGGPDRNTGSHTPGGQRAGRGGAFGVGPVPAEDTGPPRTTGPTPGGRGAAGVGLGPLGASSRPPGDRDGDPDRDSPAYLREYHDDLWDDSPPTPPGVIGLDDD